MALLHTYTDALAQAGLLAAAPSGQDPEIRYISYDSKDVTEGTLFVCKGAHFRAQYLADAIAEGAAAYVSEQAYEEAGDIPAVLVTDMRQAMPLLGNLFYDNNWQQLHTVGITGTKGKSTTAFFMKAVLDDMLRKAGKPESAVLSSIDNYDGVIREESHLTTPEAIMLQRHFQHAIDSGIEYLTMEVSSQALKYHRTSGIRYDIGCFMNLGEDHISPIEHPSVEDYRESKLLLMQQCRTAVINMDDPTGPAAMERAQQYADKIITFGQREGVALQGYDIHSELDGISFRAKGADFDEPFRIGLKGLFNVTNALAAIASAHELGVPLASIRAGLEAARVPGRMELFFNPDKTITALVDYAHNKMSYEALFNSVHQEFPGRKTIIVFGCPGKKALGRRRELGEIAGRNASLCILTEEDPGEEAVHDISEEIAGHIAEVGGTYEIIDDRGEAIRHAVDLADENTVLLIMAKGRETRQKRGLEYVPVPSDVEYVERFLAEK